MCCGVASVVGGVLVRLLGAKAVIPCVTLLVHLKSFNPVQPPIPPHWSRRQIDLPGPAPCKIDSSCIFRACLGFPDLSTHNAKAQAFAFSQN